MGPHADDLIEVEIYCRGVMVRFSAQRFDVQIPGINSIQIILLISPNVQCIVVKFIKCTHGPLLIIELD